MTEPAPTWRALELLDDLERRRRREYDQARALLIRVLTGPDGSISARPLPGAHDDDVSTMTPLAMTLQDVSDELQVALATTKRLVKAGKLRVVKVEGATRVLRADFDAYVAGIQNGADKAGV